MKTKITVRKLHNLQDSDAGRGWYWLVSALTAKHLALRPESLAQDIAFAIETCAHEAGMTRDQFMGLIDQSMARLDSRRVKAESGLTIAA